MATMLGSLRRLTSDAAALLLTRAEFASVELAQARAQLARWAGLALGAAVFALLGFGLASAWLTLALWPWLGAVTLLLLALGFGLASVLLATRLRREVESAPPLLEQTLQELARDRAALMGERAPGDDGPPSAP
jgi:uncharacterized membrane protein YqjE